MIFAKPITRTRYLPSPFSYLPRTFFSIERASPQ